MQQPQQMPQQPAGQPVPEQQPTETGPSGLDPNLLKEIVATAQEMIYGPGFEAFLEHIKKGGKEGYADNVVMALLGTLKEIDRQMGGVEPKALLASGMAILAMVSSDLVEGEVIEGLDEDTVKVSMQNFLARFVEAFPDAGLFEEVVVEMSQGKQQFDKENGENLEPTQKTPGFLGSV